MTIDTTQRTIVALALDASDVSLPLLTAFEDLGYTVRHALPEAPLAGLSTDPYAIVIVHGASSTADRPSMIERLRAQCKAPILVVEDTAASSLPLLQWLNPGILQIAGDVRGDILPWILEAAARVQAQHAQVVRYREMLRSAPVGVFEVSDGHLTYVNDYLLERTGYTLEELRARPIQDLVIPEDRDRMLQAMRDLPDRAPGAAPNVYRFLTAGGAMFVGEIRSRMVSREGRYRFEGTLRDITQDTRILRLHRIVLELTEVILAEQDIDRILQSVLDTIVEYGGFRRAVLTLYDLSIPLPFEGAVRKIMTSGLTEEERREILTQEPIAIENRPLIYSERFRLGSAYYIPHDEIPWTEEHGISGTVTIDGWHPDDYLFIPLRGADGIIGTISVDDPLDQNVPSLESIEPVAFLANFAALAVERVFKLQYMRRQTAQLHGLATLGNELARLDNERMLCEIVAQRVQESMDYEICGVYLLDGIRFVHEAVAGREEIPPSGIPEKGTRVLAEGPGIHRWVLKYGEPALIPDVSRDPRYAGPPGTIRSYLAVPIPGRRATLGVLYAASFRIGAFGEQDLEIFATVASHLTTALSAVRRRLALSRVFSFGQRLAMASSVSDAITSTLTFLVEQFDFQMSSILMLQHDGSLRVEGVSGDFPSAHIAKGWTMTTESGVIGWVARNRRPLLVADVHADGRYFEAFPMTKSELAVPILFDEQVLGVINVESTQVAFFDDEDRQLIEVVATYLAISLSNIRSREDLHEQAVRDPLTGLFNRHYFNSIISSETNRSDRYDRPLSLMMLDIDGFRAVNNRMGHLQGDEILQRVARMIERNVRDADRVIRYGGDEFLVVMPETNGKGDAERVAARLRRDIRMILEGTPAEALGLSLGLSIGVYSRAPGDRKSMEEILEEVDRRMYADKRSRNEDRADDYRR